MAFRDLIERVVQPKKLSCPKCDLNRKNFVSSKIVLDSEIAFVGGYPGEDDVTVGEAFVGRSGKIIKGVCDDVGVIPTACSWLNVVKCGIGSADEVESTTITRCGKRYLYSELLTLKPKVVVLLGSDAFSYFFAKSEWHKSLHNFRRRGEFVFLVVDDPAEIPNTLTKSYVALRRDIEKARAYIDGTLYSDREYELVTTAKRAKEVADFLTEQPIITVDIETTALRPWDPKARLLTVAFSWESKKAVCIPVDHHEIEDEQLREAFKKQLVRILLSDNLKIYHNAKFDVSWLRQSGWEVNGKIVCTMIMAYLIDEAKKRYGLKQLSAEELDGYSDIIEGNEFARVSLERLYYYNCEDADNTFRLFFVLKERMDKELWWVHHNLVIPGSMAIAESERVGFKWDTARGKSLRLKLQAKMKKMMAEADAEMPRGMSANNPNHLRQYLFEEKKYPVISKTPKGTPQANEYVLTVLAEEHGCGLAKKVIDIRELDKLCGTYLKSYPKFIEHDGRIHPTFWFTHTVTGRTAASNPNPQQLPRDKRVRELVTCEDGKVFIYGDLATAEMRIAGSLARDPMLIDIFQHDGDVHSVMGAEIANIPIEQFDKKIPKHLEFRQNAKPVNFGFLYGQMPPGFVRFAKSNYGVDFTLKQAEGFRERYFDKYSMLQTWYQEVYAELYEYLMVRTKFGRCRRFPDLNDVDEYTRGEYERQAVNMLVQSVAADIMILIYIKVQEFLMRERMETRLILTVHDSLMGEGPEDELPTIARMIDECVNSLDWPWLKVPMKMDLEKGTRWGRTEELKKGVDF